MVNASQRVRRACQRASRSGVPLSPHERLTLAVTAARPERFLTLDSLALSYDQAAAAFHALIKNLNRKPKVAAPIIYFACIARSTGHEGHHVHALLWTFLHQPTLIGAASELGFGKTSHIKACPTSSPAVRLNAVGYVLGQKESVLDSEQHLRHEPHPPRKRHFLYPQRETLATHAPQLLSALEQARDRTVTDAELISAASLFRSTNNGSQLIQRRGPIHHDGTSRNQGRGVV